MLTTNAGARHIAFRVATLEQLRTLYRRAESAACKSRTRSIRESQWASSRAIRRATPSQIYLALHEPRNEKLPLTDPNEIDTLIFGS